MNAIINADLYDYHSYRRNCYLLYDDKIQKTGSMAEFDTKGIYENVLDLNGQLVLPGMVNGHSHLYGAFLRGIPVKPYHPITFLEKLQQLFWKLDGCLDTEASYYSALCMVPEHVKCGVTTIIDHHASGGAVNGTLEKLKQAWVDEAGLRGVFAFETSDRFPVEECIEENRSFYEKNAYHENCGAMFGIHASMSISDKTLQKIIDAVGRMPVHVHVGESREDEADCMARYGKRIAERFIDAGIVNQNALFAHCTNIDQKEAARMADQGVTAVINPTSNINGGIGIPDYQLLERYGIRTIIGNDTLGTNIAADIRNTLYLEHQKMENTWWFGSEQLKKMVINNYEYASILLATKLGRLKEGYCADFLSLSYEPISPMDETNIFDHLVDGVFSAFHPRNVWCGGVSKMKDYITVYDEKAIAEAAREEAARVWSLVEEKKIC